MNRLEVFEQNHLEHMEKIKKYLTSSEPEMMAFTKFLLETPANPYAILPEHWAGCTESSSGMRSLLNHIHHALFDDGEISFPIVNGEPKIVFVWSNEDNYADYVLNETQKHFRDTRGVTYDITQCQDVFDFIAKCTEYHRTDILRCFITDAAMRGITFAVNHYGSNYAAFDPEWEFDDEIMAKIMKRRAVFGHTPVDYPEPTDD